MKYVIVGGDAAGMSAAMQIVRNDKQAEITTLEKGTVYSYAQCGLPYFISHEIEEDGLLIARSVDTYREKYGIDARIGYEVTGINPDKRTVSGEHFELPYDKLLIATGARPYVPKWEGVDLEGVHTIKTIADAKRVKEALSTNPRKVTVIGGGSVGLEIAENLNPAQREITILERSSQLATHFDKEMAGYIHKEARAQGITLKLNQNVKAKRERSGGGDHNRGGRDFDRFSYYRRRC